MLVNAKTKAFNLVSAVEKSNALNVRMSVHSSCTDVSYPPRPNTLSSYDRVVQNEAQVPTTTVINDRIPDIRGCEKGRTSAIRFISVFSLV